MKLLAMAIVEETARVWEQAPVSMISASFGDIVTSLSRSAEGRIREEVMPSSGDPH